MPMICPGCQTQMKRLKVEAVLGSSLDIDVCSHCRAFWFDPFETLQLTPGSTLELFQLIAEASREGAPPPLPSGLRCSKCRTRLIHSHDRQRNTPFQYWRCERHGRFTRFHDFLKEKNFIQPLTAQQIAELRRRVRTINCANCGGPVDLVKDSLCTYCQSPLAMLDLDKMAEVAKDYQRAAAARPVPPLLRPLVSDEPFANLIDVDLAAVRKWLMLLLGRADQ